MMTKSKKSLDFVKYTILLFCVINWFSQDAQAQNNFAKVVERLTPNVLAVKVSVGSSVINEGFGFIVAESTQQFFIITAGHVIHKDKLQQSGIIRIDLEFYSQYARAEATELDWFESDDLSLLSCPKPKAVSWNPRFANFSPFLNDRVMSIGKNQNWKTSGEGNINSINNPWIFFNMPSLEPGCSGSPLITEKGIVGMIVTDSDTSSKALSLTRIRERIGPRLGVAKWAPYEVDVFEKNMVYIQGEDFLMGCTPEQGLDCEWDEKPLQKVLLSSFYLNKYEVTRLQWRDVMNSDPPNQLPVDCDDCPVAGVSWYDVQAFIQKLNAQTGKNYRLPTEAEFEFAARGGKYKEGSRYPGSNNLNEVAWFAENAGGTTHPVGRKKPNVLGLYDLGGNVWEWCHDGNGRLYNDSPQFNPMGNGPHALTRGGSWANSANTCRVADRSDAARETKQPYLGFRLAHNQ